MRQATRRGSQKAEPAASHSLSGEVLGLALLVAAVLCGLALLTHSPADASWGAVGSGADKIRNAVGPFGANLSYALLEALGHVAHAVPLVLALSAVLVFLRRRLRLGFARLVGALLLLLSAASLADLFTPAVTEAEGFPPGGFLGSLLATGLASALGRVGAAIVASALSITALLLLTRLSLHEAVDGSLRRSRRLGRRFGSRLASWAALRREAGAERKARREERAAARAAAKTEARAQRRAARAVAREARQARPEIAAARPGQAGGKAGGKAGAQASGASSAGGPRRSWLRFGFRVKKRAPAEAAGGQPASAPSPEPAPARAAAAESPSERCGTGRAMAKRASREAAAARTRESSFVGEAAREISAAAGAGAAPAASAGPAVGSRATIARTVNKSAKQRRDFRLPPTELLSSNIEIAPVNEQELMGCAKRIVDKCAEFGVGGQILQIHPGPVVTTFELKPDAGVKLSRICSLEDDLAMALKAETIRIDRIPGKSTVGIEVPNRRREVISFRELVESDVFADAPSALSMILGKTIDGAPYVADLARMPHLLIAGSTGSGKSVALNSMITSILFKSTPDQVKFIMVDPKMLELGMYRDIPHLLTPVVTNPKLASNALKWGVREMEQRYALLAGCGVRNIDQYNTWIVNETRRKGEAPVSPEGRVHEALPFVVIVIDELADLMMVAASDVEDSICRLAQMARAVGIHLILATQRPSVDVITGVIKANLPARIAMRVASKIDSRTILDTNGAQQLLGKGDMLFLPSGSSRLLRMHGPYLSETETAGICDFLRGQRSPEYDEKVCEESENKDGGGAGEHDDELFDQAARIVVERGEASTSFLQRRLKVGYSRAARLVDMLEEDGIVGPSEGSKVRKVLVGREFFAEVDSHQAATEA